MDDSGRQDAGSQEETRIGSVTFSGSFRPEEREFLCGQFSNCRFVLVARAATDPALALVMWYGAPPTAGSPSPLFAAPRQAAYVLSTKTDGSVPGRRAMDPTLARVDGEAELHARFPDQFPGVRLALPLWERVRRRWRGWLPGLMALAVVLWLVTVFWALQG